MFGTAIVTNATAIAADDLATARAALDAKYVDLTGKLADRMAASGDAEAARVIRSWIIARVPGRRFFFLPPDDARAAKPKFAGADEWLMLRKFYAQRLFDLAKQALAEDHPSLAYSLVFEVLREDRDHALARSILDYERGGDAGPWRTRFAKRQFAKGGLIEHAKFGWLPKEHVAKYEEGLRPSGTRWISAAEDDRLKGANIARGWRVETEHYEITTNHSLEAGVECGRRLEELHTVWRQLFTEFWFTSAELKRRFAGQPSTMTVPRHKVLLFRNREQYVAHLERDEPAIKLSLGYYAEKPRTAYFYAGDDNALATWFHEATHQLFHERQNRGRPAGMDDNFWVVEGVATYMESLRKGDGYCVVGGPGAYRLQFARYRALTEGYNVPLAKLVTLGRDDVKGMGADLPKLYSLAAGLSQFFMDADSGKHRDAFVKYLDEVYRDKATATTLATFVGEPYGAIDEQYGDFLRATDDDLAALLPGEHVPRLYLGRTRITDRALEYIAKVDGLERLDVGHCPITDAGLAQLPVSKSLVQLNLEQTKINDESLTQIAKMLELRELDLSGCQISDAGLENVAALQHLETIWLTGTPVTNAGLQKLQVLENLKFVDVNGSQVTAEGLAALKRAIPGVNSEQ